MTSDDPDDEAARTSHPGDPDHLAAQRRALLAVLPGAQHRDGFGWLDADGRIDPERPAELWITCRMTHVAALGALADEPSAPGGPDRAALLDLATHGVAALTGPLHDAEHGGWFAAVRDGQPVVDEKQAYGHAFVVLAAASARAAGVDGADRLLASALAVCTEHLWDADHGLVVDAWDRAWTALDPYRGVNANMHAVECFLAAGDVTGDAQWHERARGITEQVGTWATAHQWRVPEHFTPDWEPLLELNRDTPADPFKPYGATVGHGLEWARLALAVATTGGGDPDGRLHTASVALYDRARADGWAVDGADGFVYTTDWDGQPVVRQRMHWVVAEAIAAATVLHRVTGEHRFAADATRWWAYADRHLVDDRRGSWQHELDADNQPSATVWEGRPDLYHAYQAALLPCLPVAPSFVAGVTSSSLRRAVDGSLVPLPLPEG